MIMVLGDLRLELLVMSQHTLPRPRQDNSYDDEHDEESFTWLLAWTNFDFESELLMIDCDVLVIAVSGFVTGQFEP